MPVLTGDCTHVVMWLCGLINDNERSSMSLVEHTGQKFLSGLLTVLYRTVPRSRIDASMLVVCKM